MLFDINRTNDGDAFLFTTNNAIKLNVNHCPTCTYPGNGFYKIKENLKTLPSSFIVPKGSPLMASIQYEQKIVDSLEIILAAYFYRTY